MPNQQVRLGTIYLDFVARNARFVSQLRRGAESMRRQQRAIRALRRDIRGFNRASRAMLSGLLSLRAGLLGLLGVGGLFGVGRAFVGLSDSMQLASSRLRLVTRDAEDFEGAFSGLFQIAQEARTPLLGVINLYARVGRATAQFGLTNQQILPFVRALNQAIAVSGATAQEAEAGLIQLSQGLAAGALRGDEFRSVNEQLPRIMEAVATSLGITRGELRDLATEGGLTTPVLFNAIVGQSGAINEEFQGIERTVGQALQQVRNQLALTVFEVNNTSASTGVLVAALDRIREVVGRGDVVAGITRALGNLTNAMALLLENINRVGHAISFLFVAAVAQSGIGRFIRNLGTLIFTTGVWRVELANAAAVFHTAFTSPGSIASLSGFTARFTRLATAARGTAASLRAFSLTLITAVRSLTSFQAASTAASLTLRTGFAASVAIASVAVRGLTLALRGLRFALRAVGFLLVIEGILLLIRFILELRSNVRELGLSFGAAARVAGLEFVLFLSRQLARIPGIVFSIFRTVATTAINAVKGVGRIIAQELNPFNLGRRRELFEAAAPDSEEVLRGIFGLSPEELETYRQAVRSSARNVQSDFLALLGLRDNFRRQIEGQPEAEGGAGALDFLQLGGATSELTAAQQRIQQSTMATARAFEDLGLTAITNFNNIGEAARNLASQLANNLLRILFLRPIANALGGALGGALGIPQAQHGGFHSGLTLVGERGPELVDFRSPARVTSQEDIRAAAAAGGVGAINITYAPVIESDNEAAVEAGLARAFPLFEESIRNSIGADLGRPSVLRRQSRRR